MVMVAHKLYERRCICFPIHREAFQILERGVDPHTGEQRNGIFGVLVKVSVEYPLIHEIRFAADVKENPSQIMQLEGARAEGLSAIAFSIFFPYSRIACSRPDLTFAMIVKP